MVTYYLDKLIITNKLKVIKPKSWYINKLYFKLNMLNVNISVKEFEEVDLLDIAKDSLEFIKSKQDLSCVRALDYNKVVAYFKDTDNLASSISGCSYEIKSFEHLANLTYSSDKELSQVFKALNNCGVPLNEELSLSIINNTDTTEFILLALDILDAELDRLSSVAKDLAIKRLAREIMTISEEVEYKSLLRSIKIFKEEIKKLEDLEESIK